MSENDVVDDPQPVEHQVHADENETVIDEPELFYPNLQTWVDDWVSAVFLRKDSQTVKWCPQWWAHAEAVVVLTALWEAWELQRVGDPGARAAFLVERFYPLMDRLTSANGTFQLCSPQTGHADPTRMQEPGVMPTDDAPAELLEYLGGQTGE